MRVDVVVAYLVVMLLVMSHIITFILGVNRTLRYMQDNLIEQGHAQYVVDGNRKVSFVLLPMTNTVERK